MKLADGTEIGINAEDDRTRGFTVSEGGVTVVSSAAESYAYVRT
jgi:hypothetical protein